MTEPDHTPEPGASGVALGVGRRRFLVGAGAAAGASVIASTLPAGSAHAALPDGASSFVPLPTAIRLADTREPANYEYGTPATNRIRVALRGRNGVSATASAAVLTVTAVNGPSGNFVTVFPPNGDIPLASNLNMVSPGEVTANLVTVKIGDDGSVDVYSFQPCEMIVDVLGYYEPADTATKAGRFIGLPNAQRAIDTREELGRFAGGFVGNGSFTWVDVTRYVPVDASSIVINLTATETVGPSFFTALPADAREDRIPTTSSLNVSRPGDTRAAGVIVPVTTVDGKRWIKIYTLVDAKIIVDVVGYFTGDDSPLSQVGLYVPVEPERLRDTREPTSPVGRLWPSWVVPVPLPSEIAAEASAVVVNVTGVDSRAAGFLTVTAARQPITFTSNLNFTGPGQVIPNHVITPVTAEHGLQVYSSHGAHVVVDLAGYFTGTPKIPRVSEYVNPPPPPVGPEWTLRIPRLGLTSRALAGDPVVVTDSGHSWHWSGTGFMGEDNRHVVLFAHRTEAGAPYRNLDHMVNGDVFTVTTGDRREFTYRMVRRDLTDAVNENILDACQFHPGSTLSLVACTVGHDRSKSRWPDVWAPTSLKFRIIVTGELVSWREF